MTKPFQLAIMQGRLSPPTGGRIQSFPRDTWQDEIEAAPLAGVAAIEWIYDHHGEGANPLETDDGVAHISQLCEHHRIAVPSICADWFMEERLVGEDAAERAAALNRLRWLIGRGELMGISRIVLPFVDQSALSDPGRVEQAVEVIKDALSSARPAGIELHLETSLGPDDFAALLDRLPDPRVRVNYDIGNSAALGYDPMEELRAYGHRLGSVHIKDRVLGGSTVPLGQGSADFDAVFSALDRLGYRGPFVLQVARGEAGNETYTVREQVAAVLDLADRHLSVTL